MIGKVVPKGYRDQPYRRLHSHPGERGGQPGLDQWRNIYIRQHPENGSLGRVAAAEIRLKHWHEVVGCQVGNQLLGNNFLHDL